MCTWASCLLLLLAGEATACLKKRIQLSIGVQGHCLLGPWSWALRPPRDTKRGCPLPILATLPWGEEPLGRLGGNRLGQEYHL